MGESIRVLHVDDDPEDVEAAATFLERADQRVEVLTETSATDGFERLRAERIDCVVSDYRLPGTDGLAFLRAVREEFPDLPFVLFTDRGSEEVASEAISAGVTDYLRKGDASDEYESLADAIRDAVEGHRAQREEDRRKETPARQESLLDSIFEQVPIHLYVKDEEARYVRVSTAYLDDHPMDEDDFLGKTDLEAFEGEFAREVYEDDLRVIEQGERILDKEEYVPFIDEWNLTSKVPWRGKDGEIRGLFGVSRKITERKRREEERRELNRRFQAVLDTVDAAIFMKDAGGAYRLVNDATLEILDREESAVLGATDRELLPVEAAERFEADDRRVLETGETIRREEEVPSPDGTRTRLTIKSPVFDEAGEVVGIYGVSTDVTERVEGRRELERKNERLDELASIIGHDLRNPLNLLAGAIELAEETGDPEEFERCRRMVDRMERMLEDLLTLARQGETIDDPEQVRLSAVAESASELLDDVDAELRVTTGLVVEADADRLRQLFENLFENALEHGRDDVTVRVGALDGTGQADADDRATGRGFYVADDGPGVPPEDRDRVFESGYSTARDGTGFGLAIVEEIVEAHGWHVELVESREGGARFEIRGVDTVDSFE